MRLSVDEAMIASHGQLGIDYPVEEHTERLAPVVDQVRAQLIDHVQSGRSVVLDHGLGLREERDECKRLVEGIGAKWELLYFKADLETLLDRLGDRRRLDPGAVPITDEILRSMAASWEPPHGEGEQSACQTPR